MNLLKVISIGALSFNVLVNAQNVSPTYDAENHVQNADDFGGPICKRNLIKFQDALDKSMLLQGGTPAELLLGFKNPTKDESIKVFRDFLSSHGGLRTYNKQMRSNLVKIERDIKQELFEVEKDHWDCLKERLKKTFGPFKAAKAVSVANNSLTSLLISVATEVLSPPLISLPQVTTDPSSFKLIFLSGLFKNTSPPKALM